MRDIKLALNPDGGLVPVRRTSGAIRSAAGNQRHHHCSKCGATLIRGPSVSVCENWWCESLPETSAPVASIEAWAGL